MLNKFKNSDNSSELIYFIAIYVFASIFWFFALDLIAKLFTDSVNTYLTISMIKGVLFLIASIFYLYYIIKRLEKKRNSLLKIIDENERFYRRIFDLSPIGMMMMERDGSIVDANNEYCKLTGYRYSEIIRKNVRDLVPMQDKDRVALNMELVMEGHVLNHETLVLRKDNSLAYFNLTETRIQLPQKTSGVLVIAQDMTEKRKLLEELKDSQKLLASFFNNSSVGFYIMLLDEPMSWNKNLNNEENLKYVLENEKIVEFNSAIVRLYGINENELRGMNHTDLYENILEHSEDYWQELYDEGKLRLVMSITNDANISKWIEGNYICLYDEYGRIKGHIGILYDITELIEERDKYLTIMKSFEAEEEEKNNLLNNSFSELLEKVNVITDEALILEKQLAEKSSPIADVKDKAANIRSLSEMLEKNINYLRNFIELKRDKGKTIFTIVNLTDVLKNINNLFREKAEEKNIKYIFQNGIKDCLIDGEKHTIIRLISMIIENAVKNSESGELFVRLKREEKLRLEIEFIPLNPISKNYSVDIQSDKVLTAIVNEYCERNCIDLSITKDSKTTVSLVFNNTI